MCRFPSATEHRCTARGETRGAFGGFSPPRHRGEEVRVFEDRGSNICLAFEDEEAGCLRGSDRGLHARHKRDDDAESDHNPSQVHICHFDRGLNSIGTQTSFQTPSVRRSFGPTDTSSMS